MTILQTSDKESELEKNAERLIFTCYGFMINNLDAILLYHA